MFNFVNSRVDGKWDQEKKKWIIIIDDELENLLSSSG